MGIFYSNYALQSVLVLVVFIGVFLIINEVTRKSKTLSILVYCDYL